jgi:hypothetical protein
MPCSKPKRKTNSGSNLIIMNNNSVTVLVFKYSLDAILGLIVISFFTLIFFSYFMFVAPGYIWVTLPVVIFIIYIQYAQKSPFKTRIIDENKLTLSTNGIQYGDDRYPVSEIEAVAIYLYSFENFEYRDGFVNGGGETNVYVRAPGDKNKISFRTHGEVLDFSFYLDSFAQFSAVRKVIRDWESEGIHVVLKQPFDDDFIIQEMNYYHTASGL